MSGIRVGLLDGITVSRPTADLFTRASYFSAVAAGMDSFWVPDHLNSLFPRALWQPKYCCAAKIVPSVDAYLEPWTMLGSISARNRFGRMQLGTAVTDSGRRNPAVTAQGAATMNLLTKGRFVLGIGPGEREGNEPYGVDWAKPVARFEEAVATIRALWDSKGALVNRDSPFFPLRNAIFDLPPYRGKFPPIWIAAHGSRMLRIVGRYGDGYFPGFPHTPREYAARFDVVCSAASDAGRDPSIITPAVCLSVFPARTQAEVDDAMEADIAKAGALLASDDYFAQRGAEHPLGIGFAGAQDILPQVWDEQTVLSHTKGIDPGILRDMGLIGTPADILDQAAEWRDCGVRHFVLINSTMLRTSMSRSLAAQRLFYSVARKLKKL